jgi:hypothetical protein
MTLLSLKVQVALTWIKASASQGFGMCVEVAGHPDGVALRHSLNPEDGAMLFSKDEFRAFLDGAKKGEFDHLG